MGGEVLDALSVVIVECDWPGFVARVRKQRVLATPQGIQSIPLSWCLLILPKLPTVSWLPRNSHRCK
jgi:hypothetical protein